MDKILIAEVKKKFKFDCDIKWYRDSLVSFDRDKLKGWIEEHYKVKFEKDEANDYPYFTDGGFYYVGENDDWFFEVDAHWQDIV